MPVIASISRSPQPASRSFSQADARSPWKTKSSFLILPAGVHSMTCAQTPRKRSGVYGSPFRFTAYGELLQPPAPHPSTRGKEAPKPIEVGFYKFKKLSSYALPL